MCCRCLPASAIPSGPRWFRWVFVAVGILLVAIAPGATSLGLLLYGLGKGLRAIVRGLVPLSLKAYLPLVDTPLEHC